jgi:hypothetical protein
MTWYSDIVGANVDQLPVDDLYGYLLANRPVYKINAPVYGVSAFCNTTECITWTLTPKIRDYIKESLLDGKEYCHDCARASEKFKQLERIFILRGFPYGLISFIYGNSTLTWWRTL